MRSRKPVEKRLIYKSQVNGRLRGVGLGELNRVARAANAKLGLTGLLLCHQGKFLGVLEGAPEVVDERFKKIIRDRRHGNIEVLAQTQITDRAFDWWKLGVTSPEELPKLLGRGVFAISEMVPPNAPERGATEDVRAVVRKYLASFTSLTAAPLKVAI